MGPKISKSRGFTKMRTLQGKRKTGGQNKELY